MRTESKRGSDRGPLTWLARKAVKKHCGWLGATESQYQQIVGPMPRASRGGGRIGRLDTDNAEDTENTDTSGVAD